MLVATESAARLGRLGRLLRVDGIGPINVQSAAGLLRITGWS
jgi:hypothetical protein